MAKIKEIQQDLADDVTEAERKARTSAGDSVARALDLFQEGKRDKARTMILKILSDRRLGSMSAAQAHKLLVDLQETELAAGIKAQILDALRQMMVQKPDNHSVYMEAGFVMLELGEPDEAIPVLQKAITLDPTDIRPAMPLVSILLSRGARDEVMAAWQPIFDATDGEVFCQALRYLCAGLGHFNHRSDALTLIETWRHKWTLDPGRLEKLEKRLRDQGDGSQEMSEVMQEFDEFAASYDDNLHAIGNRGPEIIGQMIVKLGWEPDESRDILDAGCGTGLCAPYLRPFAKSLHGCDLSIPMLEKSKSRNIYNLLTRTDLANPVTYPKGTFSHIVSGDVMVYFGDLMPVLTPLASALRPGGWLIFTVENAGDAAPSRGWERYSSGRFRHSPTYLEEVLPKAGFTKPKATIQDTLRTEFHQPIPGLCVATQKLAFSLT